MADKKSQHSPVTDTQVEQIIENVAQGNFDDIPVIDDLYNQDEYWIDAIDVEVSAEQDSSISSPWHVDVREEHLVEHNEPLAPVELEADSFPCDDEQQIILRYADHFEW